MRCCSGQLCRDNMLCLARIESAFEMNNIQRVRATHVTRRIFSGSGVLVKDNRESRYKFGTIQEGRNKRYFP